MESHAKSAFALFETSDNITQKRCFQYILRKKRLKFWEISISVNFICFPQNDEKFDFWPWKWGVDLYTRSTYTRVNTVNLSRMSVLDQKSNAKAVMRGDRRY